MLYSFFSHLGVKRLHYFPAKFILSLDKCDFGGEKSSRLNAHSIVKLLFEKKKKPFIGTFILNAIIIEHTMNSFNKS